MLCKYGDDFVCYTLKITLEFITRLKTKTQHLLSEATKEKMLKSPVIYKPESFHVSVMCQPLRHAAIKPLSVIISSLVFSVFV